jgi:orotate phosphoribosyltransferase
LLPLAQAPLSDGAAVAVAVRFASQRVVLTTTTGGTVVGVLAVVDREEGGREAIQAAGLEVEALVLASEIVARMA